MTLTARSSLTTVALAVGQALSRHGIVAVLTGGACASLYTGGKYHSRDMDFVLAGSTTQARLDAAMSSLGFVRERDRYVHPRVLFYVEFPRGPLAIGDDYQIRPVLRRGSSGRTLALSATDSCRDRLAAFYHWNDRQSLRVAVWIALRNRLNTSAVRRWSINEGFAERFREFEAEVARARSRRPTR
jgi:hypothetical protein